MNVSKWAGVVLLAAVCHIAGAQVVGGQFAFEFLRLSQAPQISADGGLSVANPDNDIALATQNPSLMRPGLHNQLELNYNNYYADINILNLQYGYHAEKINTSFILGVQYLNYGSFTQTDDIGNTNGEFHALDYAVSLGASRSYLQHWRYGADIKLASSTLAQYSSRAILTDVGVNYYDTASLIDIGIVARNMGGMVKNYNSSLPSEPLPFDLQLGISKKFKHLPLRLFATIHHLYEWDVRYDNPADLTQTNLLGSTDTSSDKGSHFGDKLFRHFIFGAELTIAKRFSFTLSYNDLKRRELALTTHTGLAGFAFGFGLDLNKFHAYYAFSDYHLAGATHEIGLTMALNKLFSIGNAGEKANWNKTYPDWE